MLCFFLLGLNDDDGKNLLPKEIDQDLKEKETSTQNNILTVVILALLSIGLSFLAVKIYLKLQKVEKKFPFKRFSKKKLS